MPYVLDGEETNPPWLDPRPLTPLDVPDAPPNPDVVARWEKYPKNYGTHETLAARQAYVDYV
ncbi:MAG: hypothetical protein Q8P59_06160, partial [Dehalococcoidia bacterium]|nr:hypothetical protein [Dehalococcoidia bacterium]